MYFIDHKFPEPIRSLIVWILYQIQKEEIPQNLKREDWSLKGTRKSIFVTMKKINTNAKKPCVKIVVFVT